MWFMKYVANRHMDRHHLTQTNSRKLWCRSTQVLSVSAAVAVDEEQRISTVD